LFATDAIVKSMEMDYSTEANAMVGERHMRKGILIILLLAASVPHELRSEDCNTSCGDQCRVNVDPPKICSPFGGCVQIGGGASFIEPNCNVKCEAFKHSSCATNIPLPTVPLTPVEIGHQLGIGACTVPFQVVTQAVSAQCGFSGVPTATERARIAEAKQVLITRGYFSAADFEGVSIYWCSLTHAGGIVPDRDLVYLHSSAKNSDLRRIASLLAHEMTHVKQYRVKGTDNFKCDYVRQMSECLAANVGQGVDCQDRNHHSMERDAYALQDTVEAGLSNLAAVQPQHLTPVAIASGGSAIKFDNPLLHGRTIDACILSNAFPSQSSQQCSQQAQQFIANAFCAQQGRTTGVTWSSTFTGAFQHSYKYKNDNPQSTPGEWVADDTGGAIFTSVTCT
jgi:hypothetical protein